QAPYQLGHTRIFTSVQRIRWTFYTTPGKLSTVISAQNAAIIHHIRTECNPQLSFPVKSGASSANASHPSPYLLQDGHNPKAPPGIQVAVQSVKAFANPIAALHHITAGRGAQIRALVGEKSLLGQLAQRAPAL